LRWQCGDLLCRIAFDLTEPLISFTKVDQEYSVTVWRTAIREWSETLFRLTFRREWVAERNCWRDVLVKQERLGGRTAR